MEEIIIITVIKLKSWATRSDRLEGNQIIREGEHSTRNKLNVARLEKRVDRTRSRFEFETLSSNGEIYARTS